MSYKQRLDRLAQRRWRGPQYKQYRWYQHFQAGQDYLTMVAIHLKSEFGIDPATVSDEQFMGITGIDHYSPLPVIKERLIALAQRCGLPGDNLTWDVACILAWMLEGGEDEKSPVAA